MSGLCCGFQFRDPESKPGTFAGNFPLFDERKDRRYWGLRRLLRAFQVQRGSGPVYFPPRWTGYKNSWMKVLFKLILWNSVLVQILIYIFNLHLLTFNPLLLACRSSLFPEMFYTKTPQIFIPLENHCMWWRVTWKIKFKLFTLACVFYLFQQERGIWAG